MKPNSLEHRIRRRAELSDFMGAKLETLLEQEAKHQAARMVARAIHWHVLTNRVSAGDIRGR
jgi:hypothetical protein